MKFKIKETIWNVYQIIINPFTFVFVVYFSTWKFYHIDWTKKKNSLKWFKKIYLLKWNEREINLFKEIKILTNFTALSENA